MPRIRSWRLVKPQQPFAQPDRQGRHVGGDVGGDLDCSRQDLLGGDDYAVVFDLALNTLVEVIRNDLHAFGVDFDNWFSERSLSDDGLIERAVSRLEENGQVYEKPAISST